MVIYARRPLRFYRNISPRGNYIFSCFFNARIIPPGTPTKYQPHTFETDGDMTELRMGCAWAAGNRSAQGVADLFFVFANTRVAPTSGLLAASSALEIFDSVVYSHIGLVQYLSVGLSRSRKAVIRMSPTVSLHTL